MPACPFLPDSPSRPKPAASTCADRAVPTKSNRQMDAALERLEQLQGQKLGAADNPLLVSVRSGAKFSMPGMMDTILNLGLNDKAVEALAKRSNNPRFAYDSYRRLIQMFGDVVLDVPKKKFEHIFDGMKKREEGQVRLRARRQGAAGNHCRIQEARQARRPARTFRRIRSISSCRRATPCSAAGRTIAPRPIAASTTSTTGWAQRSTCRPWSSATWARTPAPASASRAIPPPASTCSSAST